MNVRQRSPNLVPVLKLRLNLVEEFIDDMDGAHFQANWLGTKSARAGQKKALEEGLGKGEKLDEKGAMESKMKFELGKEKQKPKDEEEQTWETEAAKRAGGAQAAPEVVAQGGTHGQSVAELRAARLKALERRMEDLKL